MRRLLSLIASTCLAATVLVLSPGQADAAYVAPTLSDLVATTPGHVTGTVTTDAPHVLVQLRQEEGSYIPQPLWFANTDGSVDFDAEAWGYTDDGHSSPLHVVAVACRTSEFSSCDTPVEFPQDLLVPDVAPTVTFPDDTTIEPDQSYTVSVSDPEGGGRLYAFWQNHEIPINRTGQTTVPEADLVPGVGEFVIERCTAHPGNPGFIYPCRPTGQSVQLSVTGTQASGIDQVTASLSRFYPLIDGYRDTVRITASGASSTWRPVTFRVRDGDGAVVRTVRIPDEVPGESVFAWDGRDADDELVPAGDYTVDAVTFDNDDVESAPVSTGPVTVSLKRLTTLTWTKAISATDSLVTPTVGRCSVLRRPSAHLWAESVGLLSGYRCRSSTYADLLVSTVHAVTLPTVAAPGRYRTLAVSAYGGAAKTKPGSTGTLRYFDPASASSSPRTMSSTVGYHPGYTVQAPDLVRPDHTFRWGTYTSAYRQYDVKHFLVTLTYTALR